MTYEEAKKVLYDRFEEMFAQDYLHYKGEVFFVGDLIVMKEELGYKVGVVYGRANPYTRALDPTMKEPSFVQPLERFESLVENSKGEKVRRFRRIEKEQVDA